MRYTVGVIQYNNFNITQYVKYQKCFRSKQCNKWTYLYYIFLILEFIIRNIDQLFQENYSAMSHLSMCLPTGIYIGF